MRYSRGYASLLLEIVIINTINGYINDNSY